MTTIYIHISKSKYIVSSCIDYFQKLKKPLPFETKDTNAGKQKEEKFLIRRPKSNTISYISL